MLVNELEIKLPPVKKLRKDVSITKRCGDKKDYLFLMNYSEKEKEVQLDQEVLSKSPVNLITGENVKKSVILGINEYAVVEFG